MPSETPEQTLQKVQTLRTKAASLKQAAQKAAEAQIRLRAQMEQIEEELRSTFNLAPAEVVVELARREKELKELTEKAEQALEDAGA